MDTAMGSATVAPYGAWESPVTAADLAGAAHGVGEAAFVDGEVWWLENRPGENGRYAVRRAGSEGEPVDLLPAPWNARSRVHEYGGAAWAGGDGALVFANFADQRLYRVSVAPGSDETSAPEPLTPEPPTPGAWRYADLRLARPGEVWCVRERHDLEAGPHGAVVRDIVAVPLDGSAADDESAIRSVAGGSDFLAGARLSPSGRRLAWLAWDHPRMPWDGCETRVAELDEAGVAGRYRVVLGSAEESTLQPEWLDDDTLYSIGDRSGFWNLYRVALDGSQPTAIGPVAADIGGPMWVFGQRHYLPLDDGRLLVVRTFGTDTLAILDPATGEYADLATPGHSTLDLCGIAGDCALLLSGGGQVELGLRTIELADGSVTTLRSSMDSVPDPRYAAAGEPMTFHGPDREVHAIVYRPANPDFVAPDGERPPFVAFVHGGPTSRATPLLRAGYVYLTSRGIGVLDVNYGGSTGYGREYRNRLRGQWGVVDVEDTVAAAQGLAAAGIADGARLGIQGGSAGGWTVLAALTRTDAFACGVSQFGVAELIQFAQDTHDFESRYLDSMIGPLPEAEDLYVERAPLSHVDELSCPVLLQQGLDDPIVPPAQAELFRDALVAKGIPHAYRAYEGESHGFRKRETIIDALESALSFYGQVLGFDPPGVPKLELS